MMCRGGLLWYHDVIVFPCRVQEKYEEVYWVCCVYILCLNGDILSINETIFAIPNTVQDSPLLSHVNPFLTVSRFVSIGSTPTWTTPSSCIPLR